MPPSLQLGSVGPVDSAALQNIRRGAVPPFYVMRVIDAVVARRRAGLPVYDMSAGQPSTPAPAAVRAAAAAALDADRIGYTNALGLPALREAIAGHYGERMGMDVEPAAVAVTTGSSGGFLFAFLAAFEVGDTVVLARPGYPAYRNMLSALGCRVVELPCGPATRYQPTVGQLESLDEPPAGLVVASPANPTGTMIGGDELGALTSWCAGHGTRLISDEIYHGIGYTGPPTSAWSAGGTTVVVNSFSKYFSMTGWRIGWLLVPDDLLDTVDRLAGNFTICPPTLSQHAALAAFDAYEELDGNVARYADNRRRLLAALRDIGLDTIAPPDGAFYVYADVSRWTDDSLTWTSQLLGDTGVAVAPGVDFDPVDGGRFVRLCFAGDGDEIVRGVELLGAWAAPRS
jgi:aspartate/methionine/tyrosine aminotransferase